VGRAGTEDNAANESASRREIRFIDFLRARQPKNFEAPAT